MKWFVNIFLLFCYLGNAMSNIFASIEGACGGAKAPGAPPVGQEAPPPYTTLPAGSSEVGATAWSSPPVVGAMGYSQSGFKLGYMDFVPKMIKKKLMGSVYEDFSSLVQRVNSWIEEHAGICVVSCETITWTGRNYDHIYADKTYLVHGQRMLRGLRLWYLTELVPSPQRHRMCQILHCRTFLPKPHETFSQLLRRVNEALIKENIGGKILCVETVPLYSTMSEYKPGAVNPDVTRWTGDINKATVALCIRVYIIVTGETAYENIGYQDFVPEHDQRHADNKGFEVCSEVMDKAARWVARQQGVRFTNVQTLSLKYKKKIPFEERCIYTASETSVYLSIVRVYFVTSTGRTDADSLLPCRLTYRTFTPNQTVLGSTSTPPEFEDTRNLCDRVNQWLHITGARLFSVETVAIRRTVGSLGAEATFFRPRSESERWIYHIRMYLNGDYVESPTALSIVMCQPKLAVSEPNLFY
ncbi:hypothetical protein LSH36_5g17042 [Paralvinella palmiformis]|uniref:Uncharacterized protein n=1 Tax=Paralvinella palmiformis TaxID=53620 RepID=A0AAD9KF09_9ANNE|nr:hypothetical protein LSH36_5g17042 [Paralvinella palmiformis]